MRTFTRRVETAVALVVALGASATPGAFAAEKSASPQAAARPLRMRPRVPEFPADVKALGEKLKRTSSPAVRAWSAQNAAGVAKGPGDPETLARAAAHARWPNERVTGVYDVLAFVLVYEAAESLQASARKELDSKSEMGEMESLRLQMAMDRLSKMMSTLSNLLKKISDTAQGITQNLK